MHKRRFNQNIIRNFFREPSPRKKRGNSKTLNVQVINITSNAISFLCYFFYNFSYFDTTKKKLMVYLERTTVDAIVMTFLS